MAAVMRWAGEAEAVRRDLVMGDLLIAGTDIPRLRKSKLPPLSFNNDRYAPSFQPLTTLDAQSKTSRSTTQGQTCGKSGFPCSLDSKLTLLPIRMATDEQQQKPPSKAELVRTFKRGKLLGILFGKYSRAWGRDDKIIEALAKAHNDGVIDVLGILDVPDLKSAVGPVFFDGQTLYCSLIPKLKSDAHSMIKATYRLIEAGGNDGAAALPARALAEWCEGDPSRPSEIFELYEGGEYEAARFLTLTLRTGAAFDRKKFLKRCHEIGRNGTDADREAAIRALGQIRPLNTHEWQRLHLTLRAAAKSGDDGPIAAAISAASELIVDAGKEQKDKTDALLQELVVAATGPFGLHQCAWALDRSKEFSADLVAEILEALVKVDLENKGTIEIVDVNLAKMIGLGMGAQVASFVTRFGAANPSDFQITSLDSVIRAFNKQSPKELDDLLVGWLLDGNSSLCHQLGDLLEKEELEGKRRDIDFAMFSLSDADFGYLARKAVGYLFMQPVTSASIVFSLCRFAPESELREMEELLFNPLAINYLSVSERLVEPISKDKSDKARPVAKAVKARVDEYLRGLRDSGKIAELHPSERQRQAEFQRHSDEMAKVGKAVNDKSVFANLFTKVVVLYGNRSVSYHRIGKEEPRRIEAEMHPHGVSIEIPRVELIDPVGLQQQLLSFRTERRQR